MEREEERKKWKKGRGKKRDVRAREEKARE